ncbi:MULTISPECIES: septum site-determining protein MinC [unclassified Phenylobacterium]|uniref:septum site-determining protein MinC n=1 Tax=unclassified Phenylobacterium TaxID=2640670 RepID=UPI00083ACA6E|nr:MULTISPECIES: septum site-determining protein MinC [unclassified Phenylobacterium]
MDGEANPLPWVRIRGRSFMALVLAPETPFADWFAALDRQLSGAPGLFADRPVVADLSGVVDVLGADGVPLAMEGLAARGMRIVGVEGASAAQLAGTPWADLPTSLHGRDVSLDGRPGRPAATTAPPPATSLLIERPVRSGQSIVYEEGDVIVVGSVASGAEVIAGGSIHVYGPLRGRAIAGLKTAGARIFCRKLEAELVGVDQLYRTAEHWGADLHGQAVQVRCDRGALRLAALD